MQKGGKIVYTSLEDFTSSKVSVRKYTELPDSFCEWIENTTEKLLVSRSVAELRAREFLMSCGKMIYEQPFFRINGRCYFLDFYIPELKLAIEIDGKCHKERADEDRLRDKDFSDIGIRTIRIFAKYVTKSKFWPTLMKKFSHPKKVKTMKKRTKPKAVEKTEKPAKRRFRILKKKDNIYWIK